MGVRILVGREAGTDGPEVAVLVSSTTTTSLSAPVFWPDALGTPNPRDAPAHLHPACPWLDALTWIRELDRFVAGKGRHRLSVTCERRGVLHGDAHRAAGDALAAARLLLSIAHEIPPDLDVAIAKQRAMAKQQDADFAAYVARSQGTRAVEKGQAAE